MKGRSRNRKNLKEHRRKIKERGICSSCERRPARNGKACCEICAEKYNKRSKDRYYKLASTSLCVYCGARERLKGFTNCEHCKEVRSRQSKIKNAEIKAEVFSHYSREYSDIPMCAWPGCLNTNMMHLTIDHINGDGAEHRRQLNTRGAKVYRWLKSNNYPAGFQVLCSNHQLEKRLTNKENGVRGYVQSASI